MTEAQPDNRLPSIQVLRGIAASLVVFHHYSLVLRDYSPMHSWIADSGFGNLGACGVDIFFAISGFIMIYTTQRKSGVKDALTFIHKRILRIFPLYWFWTTVLLLLWVLGLALTSHHYSALFLVDSYLLVPSFNGRSYHPLLDQGWTLSFEMLFYLAFTCAILLKLKRSKLVFLAGAFAVLSLLSRFLPSGSGIRYLLSEPIIIEFLYGVLAAEILLRLPATRNVRWMRILPIVLISFGAIAIFCTVKLDFPGSMRFAVYGLPALLIVLGAAMRGPEHCPRILVYLGDASYSIYIMHGFFSMAYGTALKHFSVLGRLPSDAVIVVAGIATITLSSFTYPLIERRLTKALSPAKSLPVLSA